MLQRRLKTPFELRSVMKVGIILVERINFMPTKPVVPFCASKKATNTHEIKGWGKNFIILFWPIYRLQIHVSFIQLCHT